MPSSGMEMGTRIQGTGTLAAVGDNTIWASPGSGYTAYLTHAMLTVTVALATATISIEDGVGGDVLFEVSAAEVGTYMISFGEWGYELTANTLLNLTNETANATAFVAAKGYYTPIKH